MKTLQKIALWAWLLTKRLYRKLTFVIILLLIPVLVLSYTRIAATEDSGMFRIVLAQTEPDPLGEQLMLRIQNSSQLLKIDICATAEEAREQVALGKADAAWIFREDLQTRIETFVAQPQRSNAFVTVVQREENTMLLLTREKLTGSVYPYLSKVVYLSAVRSQSPELTHISDEQLLQQYDATDILEDLFRFDESTAPEQQSHYLLTPLRGLLGVTVVLSALAAAMYYVRDCENGTFGWVTIRKRPFVELGCQMVAVTQVTLVATVCLWLGGLGVGFGRELLIALLYTLCCSAFAMLLRQILGSVRFLGTALPVLIVAMIALCPVFVDLGKLRQWQYLLPPTYYVNAAHNLRYLWLMPVYSALCLGLYKLIGLLPWKQSTK